MKVVSNKNTIQKCQETTLCKSNGMFLVNNQPICGRHAHVVTIDFTTREVKYT